MFAINEIDSLEPLSIYISSPFGELLYPLDEYIQDETASLKIELNNQYQLSFSVESECSDLWNEYLKEGMYLFVDKIGLFKMEHPTSENNGVTEIKNITAYSCNSELEDKTCAISVNMGTKTSQEYLVTYEEGEAELLVNPYTNTPYDWIVLYNTYPEQLEFFKERFSKYSNGATISINSDDFAEINSIINQMPRLKHKFIQIKEPVKDESGKIVDPGEEELLEFVSFDYNQETNALESITLSDEFFDRVDSLIGFYKKYRSQLSLTSLVLEKTDGNWTVGEIYGVKNKDFALANTKCQFDIDENLYSFFTQTLAKSIECVTTFDIVNRRVYITPVEKIGRDTGIVYSYENLMKTLGVSADEENLCTRLHITGSENLGVEQVNFGQSYIDNFEYKLNIKDSNGKRIYVSDDLAGKYAKYAAWVEEKRSEYVDLSKQYNACNEGIDEIKYRVPNDDLKTDWGTFSEEELKSSLTNYKNLLSTLITLYKEDYGSSGVNEDDSVNEDFIKQTMYWYDYEAYQGIINEINWAIRVYPYYSQRDKWGFAEGVTDEEMKAAYKKITSWETDWTLYGIIELQAKIDTYTQNLDLLAESSVVRRRDSDEIYKWDELSPEQQSDFGYQEVNYQHEIYNQILSCKKSADAYLVELNKQVQKLETTKTEAQELRTEIINSISWKENFTTNEIKALNLLIRESDYTNNNIVVTSIDTYEDKIGKMLELLEDGKEKASIFSRPQLIFETDSENIFGLTEFEPFWKDFKCGNYIAVQYMDDTYIKLRLLGYEFNPRLPSSNSISLIFSNFIRSNSKISDVSSILEMASSTSQNSSSSAGSNSGNYGESDDIDITISNTMLAQLLSSEMFGTRVRNVVLDSIEANSLVSKVINSGVIISSNYYSDGFEQTGIYDINNTVGSIIKLGDGSFSFAGGNLVFDATPDSDNRLKIKGDLIIEEDFDEDGRLKTGVYLGAPNEGASGYSESSVTSRFYSSETYIIEFINDNDAEIPNHTNPYNLEALYTNDTLNNDHNTVYTKTFTCNKSNIESDEQPCVKLFRPGITNTDWSYYLNHLRYTCVINGVTYSTADMGCDTDDNLSSIGVFLQHLTDYIWEDGSEIKEYIKGTIKKDGTYRLNGDNGLYLNIYYLLLKQHLESLLTEDDGFGDVPFYDSEDNKLTAMQLIELGGSIEADLMTIKIVLGGDDPSSNNNSGAGGLSGVIGGILDGVVDWVQGGFGNISEEDSPKTTYTKFTYDLGLNVYNGRDFDEDFIDRIQLRLYGAPNKTYDGDTYQCLYDSELNNWRVLHKRNDLVQNNIFTIIDNDSLILSIGKDGIYCSDIYSDGDIKVSSDGDIVIKSNGTAGNVRISTEYFDKDGNEKTAYFGILQSSICNISSEDAIIATSDFAFISTDSAIMIDGGREVDILGDTIFLEGNVIINGGQKLLWGIGSELMENREKIINLSEPVSKQQTGIALLFSRVENGEPVDYHFVTAFISKHEVQQYNGKGHAFTLFKHSTPFSAAGSKYLYIFDDRIEGNANNVLSGTGECGITYNNSLWMLRAVIGV